MAYSNNAYDLERFAERTAKPKYNEKPKAVIKKFPVKNTKAQAHRNIVLRVAVAAVIAIMICFNIYLKVEISDTNKAIANADKEINTLLSEETKLDVQFKKIVSFSSLEEQAIALGMQKRSESQIHYIDTSSDDYAEIIK